MRVPMHMFRTLSMVLLVSSFGSIAAQTPTPAHFVQVHGTVVDSASGQLLQATVEVLIHRTDDQLAITDTNTEGHYGLVLDIGSIYDLRVKLEGYETFIETIDLRDAPPKKQELKIRMKKSNSSEKTDR